MEVTQTKNKDKSPNQQFAVRQTWRFFASFNADIG
jgi:hypothetical protein